jgi:GNAT superfamily N-acetyltransferase
MTDNAETLTVAEWRPQHARWGELLAVVEGLGQTNWIGATAPFHRATHVLVATVGDAIAGFLRFVVQEIGPDADCPPVRLGEQTLTEAKVLAFGVAPAFRRRGIGRTLQVAAIEHAERQGCYQVRSHSGGTNTANHQLKLSLGFGVHPIVRGQDVAGVYFILPLRRPGG